MKFSDIIGQDVAKRMLRQSVLNARISHAQLITGPAGFGGLPLAMAYIQYLNCTNRTEEESCGVCPSCVKMQQLAHPDVHYVFPVNKNEKKANESPISDEFIGAWRKTVLATGGYFSEQEWYRAIGLNNKQGIINRAEADEIIRKLSYKSFESEYKAVVIWLPEKINDAIAGALLKILEEPWDKTLFLMVSEAPHRIIDTIISRTQIINLSAIPTEVIADKLKTTFAITSEKAAEIAKVSMGDYLEAVALLNSEDQDSDLLETLRQLLSFAAVRRHLDLFEWAESIAATGREHQKEFLEDGIRVLRECYMINMGVDEVAYSIGNENALCRKIAPFVHSGNVEQLVKEFELAKAHIIQNGNAKIVFTHFALALSKLVYKVKK